MLKPTPNRIKAVMRGMPKGVKFLDEIQATALNNYGINADQESLLETLREIYREGKLKHIKQANGKDAFDLDEDLKGLGWTSAGTKKYGGMFIDLRNSYVRRPPLLAWLNYHRGVFSVNVVSKKLQLNKSIPRNIRTEEEAIYWVFRHAEWVK